jgi:hypothetical protein
MSKDYNKIDREIQGSNWFPNLSPKWHRFYQNKEAIFTTKETQST